MRCIHISPWGRHARKDVCHSVHARAHSTRACINQKNVEQVEISYFLKNYSQKLFNKPLSNNQIVEICNLYNEERKNMKIIENVDGFGLNRFANINSFCKTKKIKLV